MPHSAVHLLLPRDDARRLAKGQAVRLLFPIEEPLSTPAAPFRVSADTDAQFPTRVQASKLPVRDDGAAWATAELGTPGWVDVLNAGRLWNFLGDATHSTGLLRTPHGLAVDQPLTIENRYNVPPTAARVAAIELIRVQPDGQWFWLVELAAG
jgi:hypothetical protein